MVFASSDHQRFLDLSSSPSVMWYSHASLSFLELSGTETYFLHKCRSQPEESCKSNRGILYIHYFSASALCMNGYRGPRQANSLSKNAVRETPIFCLRLYLKDMHFKPPSLLFEATEIWRIVGCCSVINETVLCMAIPVLLLWWFGKKKISAL